MPKRHLVWSLLLLVTFFSRPCEAGPTESVPEDSPKAALSKPDVNGSVSPSGSDMVTTMEPVVVTAPRVPSDISRVPAAITVVGKEEIQLGEPTTTLEESLVGVPGVFVRNRFNFAQDLRISIRGFGARSAFGIRGIQVYVDGIPQTLPDGQSQIDSIDPAAIERIEVIRGPMSALYGNSTGGVINIITQEGPEKPFMEARTIFGDYGLWKALLQGGGQTGRTNGFFNLSHLQIDGHREHSEAESWKLNGKLRYDLDDVSDLTFLINGVYSPELEDPGGLTREQVEADPTRAGALNLRFDTGEEVSDGRLGLVYRRALTRRQNLEAVAYYSLRDLDNAIPFRFVELDREVFGGRVQHDISTVILGVSQRIFTGIDVQRQIDDRRNLDNLGGSPGDTLLLSQDEKITSIGAYLQEEIKLTEEWSVTVGGRYDRVDFEVDDHLTSDGDDTGSKTFDQATGRFGLSYTPRPNLQLYATVAQSFETPSTTELVNTPEGRGGINPDIEPQKAVNYEIGLKGTAGRHLVYDAALFYIQLEDELIAFRDATDRVFYRNAGESRRTGAELGLTLEIAKGVKARLAYTYMDAEFETYEKDGVDLQGNEVPGLPNHQVYGEILYENPSGFYTGLDVLYVSELYVDDENTSKDSGYTVVDLRAGCRKSLGKWLVAPFFGIQNLFDESYNSNVRINASGGRYFEPAPGLNVYGGLGVSYQW